MKKMYRLENVNQNTADKVFSIVDLNEEVIESFNSDRTIDLIFDNKSDLDIFNETLKGL